MRKLSVCLLAVSMVMAHEGSRRNTAPTAASKDLNLAAKRLAQAKKTQAAQGKYSCCVKPSCDLCLRTKGSCDCARNVARRLGACGECLAGWRAGRGSVKGVSAKTVKLLPAEQQAVPGEGELPAELKEGLQALLSAKRTLVKEKRFLCCVGGGCGQCAFEADCPCGSDLAKDSAGKQTAGVCGDCYDGWHSGRGSFAGIQLSEVRLSEMDTGSMGMTAGPLSSSGIYTGGTSQAPAARPMQMLSRRFGNWTLMFHGEIFAVYTGQGGPRGRDKFFGTGWLMPMASRRLGPGIFTARTMFSLEPLTVTNGRYPLLFQEGETWKNVPILNGQHPHDFIKELAGSYQVRTGEKTAVNLYAGLRGDPAIGPTAYPHRLSASENPLAVLSHHFQDSTHISSSVVTLGVTHRWVTLEASCFHGREPDEKRWGMEVGAVDSFASRVTVTPTSRWAAQFSLARINNREVTHPDRDSFRQTASVTYVLPYQRGYWAATLIWGRNNDLPYTQQPNGNLLNILTPNSSKSGTKDHIVLIPTRVQGQIYNSYTAESTLLFRDKNWIWGRAESADKDSLLLFEEAPYVRLIEEQRYTRVKAYTMGYSRELPAVGGFLRPALGGQFMLYQTPMNLEPVYGAYPKAVQVILRFRFAPAQTR